MVFLDRFLLFWKEINPSSHTAETNEQMSVIIEKSSSTTPHQQQAFTKPHQISGFDLTCWLVFLVKILYNYFTTMSLMLLYTLFVGCVVFVASSDASVKESQERAFKEWFTENGGVVHGLDVAEFEGMGRGIQAASDIVPDQDVLFIPASMIISSNTVRTSDDSDHKQLFKLFQDEQELITAFILFERAKGEDSFWKPYFDVLPDYIPNLGHCSAEELEGLQHPPFTNEVKRTNKKTRAAFQNFLIKTNEIWPSSVTATEHDYMWAASVVDSRAFRFKGSINLAPFSDMFNYAPHSEARTPNAGNFFLKHHKLTSAGLQVSADRYVCYLCMFSLFSLLIQGVFFV